MIKKRITNNNNDSDIQPPLSDSENEGDYSFIIKDLKSNKNQSNNHIQQKQKKQYDSDTDEICDTLSEEETNDRYIENINKLKKAALFHQKLSWKIIKSGNKIMLVGQLN